MRPTVHMLLALGLISTGSTLALALPKEKDEAAEVVIGIVQKISVTEETYDDGRVAKRWTAEVKVETVERTTPDNNRVVKAGDIISVRWSRMTYASQKTAGYSYDVKENASIRAHLIRRCGGEGFVVIDHAAGIEKAEISEN